MECNGIKLLNCEICKSNRDIMSVIVIRWCVMERSSING